MSSAIYRRSKGRIGGQAVGLPVLLLTVAGRKSGLARTTPVIYLVDGTSIVLVGSAFGSKSDPDWVKNLAVAGGARVQIKRRECTVTARSAIGEERDRLWQQLIEPNLPTISVHERNSGRLFPVYVLTRT
ncbi:nitroreductase/quinone reductase family protein [Williamsia muralis]|uniref:nitroreductase/quinone reductase family protein n=1 Tax=Williamsia marianensis TaxID=85044 RepID=UPI000E32876D